MKRLFYNCSVLLLFAVLGWSTAVAQGPGCPPSPTTPNVQSVFCIDPTPGTFDMAQLGTGAPYNYGFFSGTIGGSLNPADPITTTIIVPASYPTIYVAYVDNGGNLCFGNNNVAK